MQPGASADTAKKGDHLVLLHLYAALVDQPFKPSQATQWALSPFIHYSLLLMLRHKKSMSRQQNRLAT
jgi:hypothetical protein